MKLLTIEKLFYQTLDLIVLYGLWWHMDNYQSLLGHIIAFVVARYTYHSTIDPYEEGEYVEEIGIEIKGDTSGHASARILCMIFIG